VGRQPWIVYGVMRTSHAVTAAKGIPIGYGVLVALYGGLVVVVVWLLRRLSRAPLESAEAGSLPPGGGRAR
jgi:cytochrome bd ubiquinol oxidase subunit I